MGKANYDLEAKMDSAYRLELTREIEKIVLDEVAACPVYEAPSYYLINPKVILPWMYTFRVTDLVSRSVIKKYNR